MGHIVGKTFKPILIRTRLLFLVCVLLAGLPDLTAQAKDADMLQKIYRASLTNGKSYDWPIWLER